MSRKLFVGNLPYSVTSERLQEAFSQFGTVSSSKVIVDRETGRSRGFAFLEMETDDQGAAAMQAMNGALLDGRSIAVREAVERQPGGGGGGFGGGGGGGGRDGGGFRPRGPRPRQRLHHHDDDDHDHPHDHSHGDGHTHSHPHDGDHSHDV